MKNIFKIASLLVAAVMLLSCEKEQVVTDFKLVTDNDVIMSDGNDAATLRVILRGKDVTAESVIYDEKNQPLTLVDGKFTTTKEGEYKFWAQCGTFMTYDSKADDNGLLTVRAISKQIPTVTPDPQPANTSFVHRAFLTQYTGTECGYCPYMIKIIRELMADNTIPEKAVLAAVHSYSNSDPAYIAAPKVGSYPFMHVNLQDTFNHSSGSAPLYALVNGSVASAAKAGISVNPKLYDDGTLVVKVSVKAAAEGTYRVGAWLLEDGIYGQQNDYDNIGDTSFNEHENCVRLIDSRYAGSWAGKYLGPINVGETAQKTFVMSVKNKWKRENLHLAVIVSSEEKNGVVVCNAVDVPIDVPTPFEYK